MGAGVVRVAAGATTLVTFEVWLMLEVEDVEVMVLVWYAR
jgi:hypothetical protein